MNSAVTEKAAGEPAVTITLPDGSRRSFARGTTGREVAAAIGPGLAKAALVMAVDGEIRDLARELPDGAAVRFIRAEDEAALTISLDQVPHDMTLIQPGDQLTFDLLLPVAEGKGPELRQLGPFRVLSVPAQGNFVTVAVSMKPGADTVRLRQAMAREGSGPRLAAVLIHPAQRKPPQGKTP